MDPGRVLELLRPLVMVVDTWGTVASVHGGCGGFLGYDLAALPGRNVLELVDPAEVDDIASYFVAASDGRHHSLRLPLPFRVRMLDAAGQTHSVDVIPTGAVRDHELEGWVVTLVPLELEASPSRSLDAELAGAPRSVVKSLLAEELQVDNSEWTTRIFLVDLPARTVTGPRDDEFGLLPVLASAVQGGWSPWTEIGQGVGSYDVSVEHAPEEVRRLASDGWTLFEATPIDLDGATVAAYLRVSRPFDRQPFDAVRRNVEHRTRGLVDVTRLLYSRWRDRDALFVAATTDPLTGLSNRDALTDALAECGPSIGVLYIDIDHFKAVNDQWGHAVGDDVLREVARRISSVCRRDDVVARVGGDEFVVLLRCVDEVIAGRISRRIIEEMSIALTLPVGPRYVSVSIGLALDTEGGRDLVHLADRAMLAAKQQGRARLVLAG